MYHTWFSSEKCLNVNSRGFFHVNVTWNFTHIQIFSHFYLINSCNFHLKKMSEKDSLEFFFITWTLFKYIFFKFTCISRELVLKNYHMKIIQIIYSREIHVKSFTWNFMWMFTWSSRGNLMWGTFGCAPIRFKPSRVL